MIDVSIVSSGFKVSPQVIKDSQLFWSKKGLNLKPILTERKKDLLCASDLNSRISELVQAFSSKQKSNFVWALRGGYGMQEILPHLKPSHFRKEKIYIGFSDCTSLHYYLNKVLDLPSVHGPHANAASQKLSSSKINNEISSLFDKPHQLSQVFKDLKPLNFSDKKVVKAKMVGGNLTTLISILGTPFDRGSKGNLVFLEEVEEPAYKINRMLTHLVQTGFLKGARGVVFGHLTHSDLAEQKLILRVVKRWAQTQKLPVVSGMQAGHAHSKNRPFWLGKKSELILDDRPMLLNNV